MIYIHLFACIALAFAMFCRLRLTTDETARHVRWSIVAVFALALCCSIAPFVWMAYFDALETALIAAVVYMQWAMGMQWAKQVPADLKESS
jgi:uncharacterized membrane protein